MGTVDALGQIEEKIKIHLRTLDGYLRGRFSRARGKRNIKNNFLVLKNISDLDTFSVGSLNRIAVMLSFTVG